MDTIWGLGNLGIQASGSAVTIGVFDGVHLGHQAIMRTVRSGAERRHARSVVVTFDRNPDEILKPGSAPVCITTLRQKMALIAAQGMDAAVVLHLDPQLLGTPAEDFVSEVLHNKLRAAEVIVGRNFAFGRGRLGTVDLLRGMGSKLDFAVTIVPPALVEGITVSSTAVRGLISSGRVEKASKFLGRPFVLEGQVVAGDGLGRKLGYPTANIRPADSQIIPARGVYAVSLRIGKVDARGVANIGARPTFGGASVGMEVYIIGFSDDIYDKDVEVAFLYRLRGEIRFPDSESLVRQIGEDVALAKTLMEQQGSEDQAKRVP